MRKTDAVFVWKVAGDSKPRYATPNIKIICKAN